jgi:endonuclease YncB( thermonuclease family)
MSGPLASSPKRLAAAFVLSLLAAHPADAETARVAAALDGDTLRLVDGTEVRLAAIQAPKPPASSNGALDALARRAREALDGLAAGRAVTLETAPKARDRHGRTVALVTDDAGRLLQAELLRAGLARVTGGADQRARLAPLYEVEQAARAARRGLWAIGLFRVRNPAELAGEREGFVIVEGPVSAVTARGRSTVIALDALSLLAPPATLRLFRATGLAPDGLAGRIIRVRGWLTQRGGPTIELAYPEQIELL